MSENNNEQNEQDVSMPDGTPFDARTIERSLVDGSRILRCIGRMMGVNNGIAFTKYKPKPFQFKRYGKKEENNENN